MPTNDPHRSGSRPIAPGLLALAATLAVVFGLVFWPTSDQTGGLPSEAGEHAPAADPALRDAAIAELARSGLSRDRVLLELPDGATAVTTDAAQLALAYGLADGSIVLRELHDADATPKLLRGHPGAVRHLRLGPAGEFVAASHAATADAPASIVVWTTRPPRGRREPEQVFTLETAIAHEAFALAEDGSLLFHAAPDGLLRGHDLREGGEEVFRREDLATVTALAFRESPPPVRSTAGSPTRRGELGLLAIASMSAAHGAQVEVVAVPPPGAPATRATPEDDATVGPHRTDWWDPTPLAQRLPARLQLDSAGTSLAFTGTSRRLLIGCAEAQVVGWQPGDPTSVTTWRHDTGALTAVGAWRDQVWGRNAEGTTTVWRGDAELRLGVIPGGALGHGSRELLIVPADPVQPAEPVQPADPVQPAEPVQVERWRYTASRVLTSLHARHGEGPRRIAIDPARGTLVGLCEAGVVACEELPPGRLLGLLPTDRPANDLAFAADGTLWACTDQATVSSAGTRSFEGARAIALSPDGRLLALARDDEVVLRPLDDRGAPRHLPGAHGIEVLAFSADGVRLLAGTRAGDGVLLWRLDDSADRPRRIGPAGDTTRACFVAGSPDLLVTVPGRLLRVDAHGSPVWEVGLDTRAGHPAGPLACHASGLVAVGGGDNLVHLFASDDGRRLATLTSPDPHPPSDLAFSADGETLYVAGAPQRIEAWNLAELDAEFRSRGLGSLGARR